MRGRCFKRRVSGSRLYQGKRLSFWLERLGHPDEQAIAQQAIQRIGTNALPILIEMLQARDTQLKQLLMTWAEKQKLVHVHFKRAEVRRQEAKLAYVLLYYWVH